MNDNIEGLFVMFIRKPHRIDSEVLRSMKMVQNVGYAPNPGSRLRNQVNYKLSINKPGTQRKMNSNVPDSPLERGNYHFLFTSQTT